MIGIAGFSLLICLIFVSCCPSHSQVRLYSSLLSTVRFSEANVPAAPINNNEFFTPTSSFQRFGLSGFYYLQLAIGGCIIHYFVTIAALRNQVPTLNGSRYTASSSERELRVPC